MNAVVARGWFRAGAEVAGMKGYADARRILGRAGGLSNGCGIPLW